MNLKRVLLAILFISIALILVVIIKTISYPFYKTESNNTVSMVAFSPSEISIQRFSGGIRIPTVSQTNYEETNFEPFDRFKEYLPSVYPRIYEAMDTTTINEYGLLFHWKGKNSQLRPILFLSHYDVVPVLNHDYTEDPNVVFQLEDAPINPIDTLQTDWDYPAFSGAVVNGRIYGRGTLDMKGMLFSILEAADMLISEGFQPEQDIWFAFGHDEETGGLNGAVKIAEHFRQQGLTFDAVYDEGGIITAPGAALENVKRPLALVGLGEKGFLSLRLKIRGIGGHASMPPKKASLVLAAEIIEKLNENQMPAHIIPPIASFFDNVGAEMSFVSRLAISNQWLLKPVLIKSLSSAPASNALIRTTTAISMAKGSDAPNVLASIAEVTVNFRILPGDKVEDVMNHVKEICKDYDVQIETVAVPREASGISPENTRGFEIIKENIAQLYPDAIVSSYITIGGTDAYKYQGVSDNIYRFMPVLLNNHEQGTIHNENEHISIENFGKMIWYFKEIMRNY